MKNQVDAVVVGGGGFIGGHLVGSLLAEGQSVRAVDIKPLNEWDQVHPQASNLRRNVAELESAKESVRGAHAVYNLAADMGGMGFIETHKARCMLSVLISTHVLMAAREYSERYFYSSSACVYNQDRQASPEVKALKEEYAYPAMPEDGYGWEKLFSERMCRHFLEDFGFETRVARLHNVYGEKGTWRGGREKAPAAICRKVAEAVVSGNRKISIWGDGNQTRSFTYITDAITGIRLIMDGTTSDPINVGSSELVTVNQLVSIVEKIASVQLERAYDLSAPQGVRGRNSDNEKILELYGWEPSTPLASGLERTYAWVYDQVAQA